MPTISRRLLLAGLALGALGACGDSGGRKDGPVVAGNTPEMQRLVAHYAAKNDVPESLIHRVIMRESRYNPRARNGTYYGLMQIAPQTARTMGYRGDPSGLLDARTNLEYAVKYLRGAWMVSDGSHDQAVRWYSRGYYYEAKRRGLLRETGLRS